MRFFVLKMSSKDEFSLNEDTLKKILSSKEQIVELKDNDNKLFAVINKAHIVCCQFDLNKTRDWQRDTVKKLKEPDPPPLSIDIDKYRPDFLKKTQNMTVDINKLTEKDIGRWVEYRPTHEIGKIKSFTGNYVFVVYKCNNEWDRFQDFTAMCTLAGYLEFIEN